MLFPRATTSPRPWRSAGLLGAIGLAGLVLAACSSERPADLVVSARTYIQKDNSSAAIIQLKNALQKEPDLAEARFLLGKVLADAGDPLAAEKELNTALELKYPAAEVNPILARVMAVNGEYQAVIDRFSQVQATTPRGNAELRAAVGEAMLQTGQRAEARNLYREAEAADPSYVPAIVGEALILASEGLLPDALRRIEAATAISPPMPQAWHVKGEVLAAMHRPDDAAAAFRKALEIKREFVPAHAQLVALLLRENRSEAAVQALAAMKQVAPRHPQTFLAEALVAVEQKNYPAARDAIQQHLQLTPDSAQGLLVSGTVDYRLGSYATAEQKLVRALQKNPEQIAARRVLVATYMANGQNDRAIEALKPLLEKADRDPSLLNIAGEAYLRKGDTTNAAGYFKKAAALDPEGASQHAGLGLTYIAQGDVDRGMKELETAAAADPGSRADLLVITGNLQRRQFDAAIAAIDALEKKLPGKAITENLRGLALLGKSDIPGGRSSFERALTREPDYMPAMLNLMRLDVAEGKAADAEARFRAAVARNGKNGDALAALAQLRAGNGASSDEVVDLLRKAIAATPASPGPRLSLIGYYLRLQQPANAITAAQDALGVLPGNADVLEALGRAQLAAGDADAAIITFTQLTQTAPRSALPFQRLAEAQTIKKDYDSAARNLRRALAIKPDLLPAQRALIALELLARRVPEAQTIAKDVQTQRPGDPIGFVLEGDIYASKRFFREAAAAYRKGAELNAPGAAEAAAKLHETLKAAGQQKDAERAEAAWLTAHPNDIAYQRHLAQAAEQRADHAMAVKYYQGALQRRPDDPVMLNNLAWNAWKLKDPRAIEYAEKAYKLAPRQPSIMDTLAVLLLDKGDVDRAADLLQQASRLAPGNPDIRLHLAQALVKSGRKDAARKELEELAKLGSKYPQQEEVARLSRSI